MCRNEFVVFSVCLSKMWVLLSTTAANDLLDETTSDWVAGGSLLKSSRAVKIADPPCPQAFEPVPPAGSVGKPVVPLLTVTTPVPLVTVVWATPKVQAVPNGRLVTLPLLPSG